MSVRHPLLSLLDTPATRRQYRRGAVIFREGDADQHLYILVEGVVVAYRTGPNGQQRILQFFVPGDVYGNITLTDGIVHTMTTEALSPVVTTLEIGKQHVKDLSRENPDLLWYLYDDLARKLRHMSEMVEASYLAADQRIARGLVDLCLQFGYRTDHGVELRFDVTQEALARYTGTSRVTVAKTLSRLVAQGVLRTRPKPWLVRDVDVLLGTLAPNRCTAPDPPAGLVSSRRS